MYKDLKAENIKLKQANEIQLTQMCSKSSTIVQTDQQENSRIQR